MNKDNYAELQARMDKENRPLVRPWQPVSQDAADEPEGLQRFLFHVQQQISGEIIEDQKFSIDWAYNEMHHTVALRFNSWLYGEVVNRYLFKEPQNWFQHLKKTVLPSALEKYWPVRYQTVEIEVRVLYPGLRKKLHYPDEENVIHLVEVEKNDEEE